jgi:ABC-2 type transport system ATP-binding protein
LVLGPNGAGKSTLMKILTTYITADEGTATVNGQDVPIKSRTTFYWVRRAQSVVFDLYVREYLAFNADVYKVAKSRIEE